MKFPRVHPRILGLIQPTIVVLLAFLPPLVLWLVLNPTGPAILVFGVVFVVIALGLVRRYVPSVPRPLVDAAILVVLAAMAAMIAVNIIIIPFSAYLAWFDIAADGSPRGSVSFVFVIATAFFSTAFATSVHKRGFVLPIVGTGFVISLFMTVIYQRESLGFLTVILFVLFFVVLVQRSLSGTFKIRSTFSILFMFSVSFFVAAMFGGRYEPQGSYIIDSQLSPNLRDFVVRSFPRFPVMYAIPGYGYSFEQRTFGESPILSSNAIFSVFADPGSRVYLRTEASKTFDGRAWGEDDSDIDEEARPIETRPLSAYRAPAPIEMGYELGYDMGMGTPLGGDVHVTLLGDFYPMLPHTLDMVDARVYSSRTVSILGARDTGFKLDPPIVHRDTIIIERRITPPEPEEIERPENLDEYTRVYDVPDSIRELAATLQGETQFETATNIRDYLAEESEYTLEVPRLPQDADFVEHFLFESRKGFCVQYATAFTVLARLNGIPTRYVSGFLVYVPDDTNYTTVSGLSAHAWPEIWLPEFGWNIVEATPPMQSAADLAWFYRDRYGVGADSYTRRQLDAIIGRDATDDDEDDRERVSFGDVVRTTAPAAGGTVFVGALIALGVIGKKRDWFVRTPDHKFSVTAGRLVRAAARSGVESPTETGWKTWHHRVRSACGVNHGAPRPTAHARALTLVWSAYFGGRSVREIDVEYLKVYRTRVSRTLRGRN
ncbi:MAG: transglutaminase domain-containing protein [Spirochaetaceae bacterium]|nr:MAG: transglutaminase domain-containing protein [Spirochaetaceae bacterium]